MREIKFRAWDKEKGKMFEPTFRAYAGELEELNISLDGRLGLRKFDGYYDQSMFPERFEIMQYTGLKDKNGVEIYEGDVVSMIVFEDNAEYLGDVVFENGCFCLNISLDGTKYKVPALEWKETETIITVVGNIYENTDLLEREGK